MKVYAGEKVHVQALANQQQDVSSDLTLLDSKLSPCFERRMFSSGLFPGICSLNANVSEHSVPSS
jgi:hypothetical protein